MKIAARDAAGYLARPDAAHAGVLLFGADAMRVALKRAALITAMIGPDGAAEMRLTRIDGAALRRDPAALDDAVRASGFFPGSRAVHVEEATDANAEAIRAAITDWRPGDARIVVTAGALQPRSALRKLFETAKTAVAIGIYNDPPRRDEIETAMATAGVGRVGREAMGDLEALAHALDPGDFAQFLEKLALYKRGDDAELSPADIAACAPAAPEAELDALMNLVADGETGRLAAELRRVGGRNGSPTGLTIAAARHFRTLYLAAGAPEGPDAALARARPPVFGPRRARMAAQARAFGPRRLETALDWIFEAELRLRSGRPTPGLALVERLFVRIAMLRSA